MPDPADAAATDRNEPGRLVTRRGEERSRGVSGGHQCPHREIIAFGEAPGVPLHATAAALDDVPEAETAWIAIALGPALRHLEKGEVTAGAVSDRCGDARRRQSLTRAVEARDDARRRPGGLAAAHHQDRSVAGGDHLLGDAAQNQARDQAMTTAAEDDEVGVHPVGDVEDDIGGAAEANVGGGGAHAGVGERLALVLDHAADGVLELRDGLGGDRIPRCVGRPGEVPRSDDVDLGVVRCGEVGDGAPREAGVLRPIGGEHQGAQARAGHRSTPAAATDRLRRIGPEWPSHARTRWSEAPLLALISAAVHRAFAAWADPSVARRTVAG